MDGAARACRADAVAGGVTIAGQHVDVVAERLEVVGGEVSRYFALGVQYRRLLVGPLGEVAAEAAGIPRAMAGDATHRVVLVGAGPRVAGERTPFQHPVIAHADRLGEGRLGVVVGALRIDGGLGLLDLPGKVLLDHRVLIDAVALDHKPFLP